MIVAWWLRRSLKSFGVDPAFGEDLDARIGFSPQKGLTLGGQRLLGTPKGNTAVSLGLENDSATANFPAL